MEIASSGRALAIRTPAPPRLLLTKAADERREGARAVCCWPHDPRGRNCASEGVFNDESPPRKISHPAGAFRERTALGYSESGRFVSKDRLSLIARFHCEVPRAPCVDASKRSRILAITPWRYSMSPHRSSVRSGASAATRSRGSSVGRASASQRWRGTRLAATRVLESCSGSRSRESAATGAATGLLGCSRRFFRRLS